MQRPDAYTAAGKLTKPVWLLIIGGSVLLSAGVPRSLRRGDRRRAHRASTSSTSGRKSSISRESRGSSVRRFLAAIAAAMTAALAVAGAASAEPVARPALRRPRRMGEVGRPVQPACLSDGVGQVRRGSAGHRCAGRRGVDRSARAVPGRRHSGHARTIHVPLAVRRIRRSRQDQLESRAVATRGLQATRCWRATAIPAAQKNRSSGAPSRGEVAALVDHTLLKPEATDADVTALVGEAAELGVYAVCVSPSMVAVAKSSAPTGLHIAAVAGFPSGKHLSAIKAAEAAQAVAAGADEIDMVIDVGAAVSGDFDAVRADIVAVRAAVPDVVLKVIVESAALLSLADDRRLGVGLPGRRRRGRRFREDLHRISPRGRRIGARGGGDGRRRRSPRRGQGQRRHPHRRRRRRDACRGRYPARAVGHPRGARRAGLRPRRRSRLKDRRSRGRRCLRGSTRSGSKSVLSHRYR